jgi:hypothetical protein
MLLKTLTYEEALSENPGAVAEVLKTLRKSRSKNKKADPATLSWSYGMALSVQCLSLMDRLSGKKEYDEDFTLDQKVADYMSRCTVWLSGGGYTAPVAVPAFVGEDHRKHLVQLAAEQAAFEALPRAEQLVQQEELLSAAIRGGAVGVIIRR